MKIHPREIKWWSRSVSEGRSALCPPFLVPGVTASLPSRANVPPALAVTKHCHLVTLPETEAHGAGGHIRGKWKSKKHHHERFPDAGVALPRGFGGADKAGRSHKRGVA